MAAEDLKSKKRKGAVDSAPKPKKQKKSDDTIAVAAKKSNRAQKGAVEPVDSLVANLKPTRKKAEDFFDEAAPVTERKSKKSKAAADTNDDKHSAPAAKKQEQQRKKKVDKPQVQEVVVAPEVEARKEKAKEQNKGKQSGESEWASVAEAGATVAEPAATVRKQEKKSKKDKKSKQAEPEPAEEVAQHVHEAVEAEDDEDIDDQTAALLAGFESDDESENDTALEKAGEGDAEDAEVPKLNKKQRKLLKEAKHKDDPGVVYLGRIPHGFFEPQMKKYFSQFGDVTRLRLSRNKKTGKSKHFAFIEFASAGVADIVARTMDNYLMFGHILRCKLVPPEQVHHDLFKYANQRFKVDPRNKKEGKKLAQGAERGQWDRRIQNEKAKRDFKAKQIKDEYGYEFEPPAVKPVDEVPRKVTAIEAAPVDEDAPAQQLLTETRAEAVMEVVQITESAPDRLTISETVTVKKPKKGAKGSVEAVSVTGGTSEEVKSNQAEKKDKKDKKRRSDAVVERNEASEDIATEAASKPKKAKKEAAKVNEDSIKGKKRIAKPADESAVNPKKAKKAKA